VRAEKATRVPGDSERLLLALLLTPLFSEGFTSRRHPRLTSTHRWIHVGHELALRELARPGLQRVYTLHT
jgi:hypothetical protein